MEHSDSTQKQLDAMADINQAETDFQAAKSNPKKKEALDKMRDAIEVLIGLSDAESTDQEKNKYSL